LERRCRAVVISAVPALSASSNLTRRANHRHIFIVARIKPAPENPLRAFLIDASAPLRKPSFQALAFKHVKPTNPLSEGGPITDPSKGVRKYL
jgi:hypothetical protein